MLAAALWGGILHRAFHMWCHRAGTPALKNRCLFIRGFVDSVPASGISEEASLQFFPYYGAGDAAVMLVPNGAWSQKGPSAGAGWWGSPGMLPSLQPPQQAKAEDGFLQPVLPSPRNFSAHLLWLCPIRGQRWRLRRPLHSHLPVH